MTYLIFAIVALILMGIASLTGLTYNTVNILVYYLLIPLSWAWMGDKIIGWGHPWLTMAWGAVWIVVFLCTIGKFQAWCDMAFMKSVDFLNWFKVIKWNYYVASVYICVWVPLIIYAVLAALIFWRHPELNWRPLAIGAGATLAVLWVTGWCALNLGITLHPSYPRSGHMRALTAEEQRTIDEATEGMNERQIVDFALKYTASELEFQFKSTTQMQPGEGNCITYSALCTAVANYAFNRNGINARARHDVITVHLFGIDMCQIAGSRGGDFFADHDFVTVTSPDGAYSVDPTMRDLIGNSLKTKQ